MEGEFKLWLFRERGWQSGDAGRKLAGSYREPAEAADKAEEMLKQNGVIGQSYIELRFNGDSKPHTVVCFLDHNRYGIWNTESVKWPIYYPEPEPGQMLADFPFEIEDDGNTWEEKDEADTKEKSDEGDMRLDAIEPTDEEEEESLEEDDSTEPEEDSGEDEEDDPSDDGSDDLDDFPEDEDDGEDSEGEREDLESDDNDLESEENEMPRLKIFAKMRGPLGWRKRAEAEELNDKNVFAMKVGILDPEAEKPGQQEREVFLQVEFTEFDEDRQAGVLRLKLPEGVELSERTRSGWIIASIPYRQEDDE